MSSLRISVARLTVFIGVGVALLVFGPPKARNAFAEKPPAPAAFPSLQWVLETARQRAPEVVSQRGALEAADATMLGARLSPLTNPYVEAFADRRVSGTGIAVQGTFWVPIEVSGQRSRRVSESEALSSWQRTGLEAARAIGMGRAVAAYGAVMVGAERVRFLSSVLVTAKEEAAYYEGRFREGDATVREAKLAAVEVARNTTALQEVAADLTRTLAGLAALLGLPSLPAPTGPMYAPPDALWQRIAQSADELAAQSPAVISAEREATYFDNVQGRQAVEAHAPFNFIVSAARGDLGDARVGGGLAWTLPIFRKNQGEQGRAKAEQARALEERSINEIRTYATLRGIAEEGRQVQQALLDLRERGEPAAEAALQASLAIHRAGKGDLLFILASRRDLALMKISGLLLVLREWSLLADFVTLTGKAH